MNVEIGSSDAPVILGVSPHSTPWRLWATLVGLIERVDEPDEVMKAGTKLQDAVLDMELEEMGIKLVRRQITGRCGPRRATPDGAYSDFTEDHNEPTMLFEVKCLVSQPPPSPRVADVVQCLHQLLVFGLADHVRLIYFGGLRRERFIIPRHRAAMDRVLRAEEAFLELVEKETPPPVVAADCDSLWRGWPLVADRTAALPDEARAWDLMAEEARREMEDARERYDLARARIKAAMGDARYGVIDGVRYTWGVDSRGVRSLRRKERNGE